MARTHLKTSKWWDVFEPWHSKPTLKTIWWWCSVASWLYQFGYKRICLNQLSGQTRRWQQSVFVYWIKKTTKQKPQNDLVSQKEAIKHVPYCIIINWILWDLPQCPPYVFTPLNLFNYFNVILMSEPEMHLIRILAHNIEVGGRRNQDILPNS